ncbi:MAG: tRNA dihydrouridine synthase DusB [Clostridia bacterium]
MKLATLDLPSQAVLAPIAGYSDVGFRKICATLGAGLTYTEMVSAKGLCYDSENTLDLLATTDSEKLKAVQIFGAEPYYIEKATCHKSLEKFDLIDINMGCPMQKIVKNGEGSALLNKPELAEEVVRSACRGPKPVSVKIRLGFGENEFVAVDFAKRMQDAGACAITVHGRTRAQMYTGNADWEKIAQVAQAVTIPVFANGDVKSVDDFHKILQTTGAQGVMLARGALGHPTIFAEIAGKDITNIRLSDLIVTHLDTMLDFHSDKYVLNNFKKHIAYYSLGKRNAKQIKLTAYACHNCDELRDVIRTMFAEV